jgi:phosphoribosylformylglycinamidine cyclo-ligase
VTYKDAGVDIGVADESVKTIGSLAKSTFSPAVLNDIGLFAGFFELDLKKYAHPVIVSSIDGVGTKLKIAFMLKDHKTVGQDLVNHCVNDIMTCGSDPLFFLDYIGTQKLDPLALKELIGGMAQACRQNGCALIGGETAEMPGFYSIGEYDLAGCMIGAVNREEIIDGSHIQKGDVLIGLPSNGFHTNGYSLIRKVLLELKKIDVTAYVPELRSSWAEALLQVHKSYQKSIRAVRHLNGVNGISHITGGGIIGNTRRLLRQNQDLHIDWQSWEVPPVFQLLQKIGAVSDDEMRRVFNMGIGLLLVIGNSECTNIINTLKETGESPVIMGAVI